MCTLPEAVALFATWELHVQVRSEFLRNARRISRYLSNSRCWQKETMYGTAMVIRPDTNNHLNANDTQTSR